MMPQSGAIQRIVKLLRTGPREYQVIQEVMEMRSMTLRGLLGDMARFQLIERDGETWRLTAKTLR